MGITKADIIAQLQREILPLQGFKPIAFANRSDFGLGPIKYAFPNDSFPIGAIHEFICSGSETAAATSGFIAGIVSSMMKGGGVSVWISNTRTIFPPSLKSFGIEPDKIIFVNIQKHKDILWVFEEALKCEGLAAVIGEIRDLSFTESRRLQLAVEQSRVNGFIIRIKPRLINITACLTRWNITPITASIVDEMPGVGFPRWNVELLKVRNGKPGSWQIEWRKGRFAYDSRVSSLPQLPQKKTG